MRWFAAIVSAMGLYTGAALGAPGSVEIGVLTCTIGHVVDAVASDQKTAANEAREMVCSFRALGAPEETYAGLVKAIGGTGALPENRALLWSVRAPVGTVYTLGLLQQSYAVDATTPSGQTPPLIGERNGSISLFTMAEKQEGSASKEKQPAPLFVIADIELVLQAAVG
jgi:Protein of unknown function (DUF992)